MAQVRQGVALLESLLCDDNAYLDPPTSGSSGTNATDAVDTTCISPNQPWNTGRNLVWAVPPAMWNWGAANNPTSGHAQLQGRTAYLIDNDFYEMVMPGPTGGTQLGRRGYANSGAGAPGGAYNYDPGGWQVGQFGYQTIKIKRSGWYYFGLNLPFKAGLGSSSYVNPAAVTGAHVVENDAIRIHAQLWVNNAIGETDTFGSDWCNGGALGGAQAAMQSTWYPISVIMNRHKKYGNAQYSTCVYLEEGDLVQIRVKGMAEVYNGPAGTIPTVVTHGQTTASGNTRNKEWDQVIFDSWESSYYGGGTDTKDANPASLMIEHIPDVSAGGFPCFLADATTSAGNGNFYPVSETIIKYATPRRVDSAYSYNFAQYPGRVTIDEEGFYQFSFHFRYQIDFNVDEYCGSVVRVYKNGTLWNTDGPGEIRPVSSQINRRQRTIVYNDTGGGGGSWQRLDRYGTANYTTVVKLNAGDYIEFRIQRENENNATTVTATNNARGELTIIQITAGSTPDGFAVYTKGHPSSTQYESPQGGSPYPHSGTITVNTEHYTHLQTVTDKETYRLDTGWIVESQDNLFFQLIAQRVKSRKQGYLFMCYAAGATVNTSNLGWNYSSVLPNAASNEWQNGYGFGGHSGGSSSIPYGTYGADPGDPATSDWFSGNQMWIVKRTTGSPFENIVARGLQMGLTHWADTSQSTSGAPMNRKHLFASHIQIASNADRHGTWNGSLPEFPANQEFEVHTSNYAHAQSYPLLIANVYNSFPGAMHRTRSAGGNDIEVTRFYVRNLKRLPLYGSGNLTPFNDPTISGDIDRVIHGSGAPVAEPATTAGAGAFTTVASGDLTVEAATVYADVDYIHIIDPAAYGYTLVPGPATTTGEGAFLLTASGTLYGTYEDDQTDKGYGDRLPQFTNFGIVPDIARVAGVGQYRHQTDAALAFLESAVVLSATVTYATQGTGALAANPAYGCGCENGQIIHNNPGDSSIDSGPASILAEVARRSNASGALTAGAATVTGDEITVYREGEGALATSVPALTITATLSREVAGAPTAEVATTTGTATPTRIASGTLTAAPPTLPTITVIWVTTQASGALTAGAATIFGDIERANEGVGAPTAEAASIFATTTFVHAATGDPVAEPASVDADVDIIRENQNTGTANITAEPATILAVVIHRINASGSLTAGAATTTGTIVGGPEGEGEPTAEAASVTTEVDISRMASAAPTAEQASTTFVAALYRTATAELQAATPTVSASGAVSLQASGTLTAAPPTLPGITVIWVTTQASGTLTAGAATVTGDEITVYHHATVAITPEPAFITADVDIIRENQNEGTANITAENPTIGGQVVHVIPATSATTAEPAFITAEVSLNREGSGTLVAASATTAGTASVTTQFTSSNITASVATTAGAGIKVHTETATIQPLPAFITADVDIIRENQNTGTANITAEPATVTPSVSLIKQASVALTVLVPSTTATGNAVRQGSGTLAPELPAIDGYFQVRDELTCVGDPVAEPAFITADVDIIRETQNTGTANITAEPAFITADVDIIRENQNEGTANITAEPATVQGTGQTAQQLAGTLTAEAATVLGTIDRVVFFTGTPNLSPSAATITGIAGTVLAPSINYNMTLPSQSYVVFGIFF